MNKLFLMGMLIVLLPSNVLGASILVKGTVVNQTPPNRIIKGAKVYLLAKGNMLQAEYSDDSGEYKKRLHPNKYLKEDMRLIVTHPEYVQANPDIDNIRPEAPGTTEHHIPVKTKKHIAETLVLSAKTSAIKGDYTKALDQLDTATTVYTSLNIYSYKIRLLGDALKENKIVPLRHSKISSDVNFLEFSRTLSNIERYKLYLQLGYIYTNVPDPEKKIDENTSYYDAALEAFSNAKLANPINAKPYQGEYKLHTKVGNNFDAATVISEYFKINKSITRENTVRTFLSDWLTSFEKVTGFPLKPLSEISSEPAYKQMAADILENIKKYNHLIKNDGKSESVRIISWIKPLSELTKE